MNKPAFDFTKRGDRWGVVWGGRIIGYLTYDRHEGWTSDLVPFTGHRHITRQKAAEVLLVAFQNQRRKRA